MALYSFQHFDTDSWIILTTSGQSNLTKRQHHCRTWMVQSYSSGGAKVTLHLIHASLDPPKSTYQTASWSVQTFVHSSWQWVHTLHNVQPLFPSKFPLRTGDLRLGFLRPTRVHIPNSISISSAIFCRTHDCNRPTDRQTDRQTDHATPSVTIGHMYIHSTVMQPNNKSHNF